MPTPTLTDEELTETFAALANTTRRAMLLRLAEGEASVTELAEPFDLSLPAISKHIKVLENAGLVERSRNAQMRPCRINSAPLQAVAHWADQYRRIWEARFDHLDSYLQQVSSTAPVPPDTPPDTIAPTNKEVP